MSDIEKTLEEHSLKIQELQDEISFKKWKIETLLEKIDNLTDCVQDIQRHQLKDESDIKERVTRIESTITTLKWITGVGLSALGVLVAYLTLFMTNL